MSLTNEDALRLNVLIANVEAIRIDENTLTVYGLQGEREVKVTLNPNCRNEQYLQQVRELLSGQVLGSPGGYPVFLRRWTRMGQINNEDLDKLLMIGEPEAVVAVSRSRQLTDELARRAWWVAPYSENARRMLENPVVVAGRMGPVLAEFLVEHLPFESEHQDMLDTVRLVLQPGLIGSATRKKLWDSGRTRKTYRVGFLATLPDVLPDPVAARPDLEQYRPVLAPLVTDNPYAALLLKLLDSPGQTFLEVGADVLQRPADQDVVTALVNAIGSYFRAARPVGPGLREIEAINASVESLCGVTGGPLCQLLQAVPELAAEVRAMMFLAHIDEAIITPIFAHSDAVGTVMRKKIEPVVTPILQQFAVLRGRLS
ncbi:MAG: sulfur reduction protein DsrS [Gammaproteobacteria bacterium HGW-Gammaproteobacteria-1]|jgi:hypothetical protein|nr:MAG: sulfur reduction protein DsrS [Gammaproteobacteria bacterium HGW-Gammaproteobacteria-1]